MVKRTTISMRPELWRAMEEMLKRGMFKNPSDFIQHLIRRAWEQEQASHPDAVAALEPAPATHVEGKTRRRKAA